MKIQKVTNTIGRDFWAIIECEHCNSTEKLSGGYNDSYYHNSVLPAIKCKACGKARAETRQVTGGYNDATAFGDA